MNGQTGPRLVQPGGPVPWVGIPEHMQRQREKVTPTEDVPAHRVKSHLETVYC